MSANPVPLRWQQPREILSAARSGDRDAFVALVAPLVPNLHRLAHRLTRSPQDAEDVCQESILKAFTKLPQFTEMRDVALDDFRCWLTKITVNSAIDFNRRNRARRLISLEEYEHGHLNPYAISSVALGDSPEGSYVHQERSRLVARAMARLPNQLRQVCFLRYAMELSTKEVAARMSISTNAVRLRLFRAHRHLRRKLGTISFAWPSYTAAQRCIGT